MIYIHTYDNGWCAAYPAFLRELTWNKRKKNTLKLITHAERLAQNAHPSVQEETAHRRTKQLRRETVRIVCKGMITHLQNYATESTSIANMGEIN